jgi:hypothetical protein
VWPSLTNSSTPSLYAVEIGSVAGVSGAARSMGDCCCSEEQRAYVGERDPQSAGPVVPLYDQPGLSSGAVAVGGNAEVVHPLKTLLAINAVTALCAPNLCRNK